ncbi:NAD(P)-binding protein [Clavulina sp. PMI_390]|nr:NAD(P)-binding protein [Clavulina sp. PMI_390]
MPSLSAAKASNASVTFPYRPVALFVGGTAGIGQGIAEVFARHTKGNAHIILCGRNENAAKKIIATFPKTATSKYEFLYCDAAKLKNVAEAVRTLKTDHGISKLNYLVLSQGYFAPKAPFYDNGEGLDEFISLAIYSRFKFIDDLLPLLQAAKDSDEEGRVMSVLAAGHGGPVDMDDIGFKKSDGHKRRMSEGPTYVSAAVEAYAKRNPGISFTHCFPGPVKTNIKPPPGILWATANWLFTPLKMSATDCGEWQLSALLNPTMANGAFHTDHHAEPYPAQKLYLNDEVNEAVYNHLMETFAAKK